MSDRSPSVQWAEMLTTLFQGIMRNFNGSDVLSQVGRYQGLVQPHLADGTGETRLPITPSPTCKHNSVPVVMCWMLSHLVAGYYEIVRLERADKTDNAIAIHRVVIERMREPFRFLESAIAHPQGVAVRENPSVPGTYILTLTSTIRAPEIRG